MQHLAALALSQTQLPPVLEALGKMLDTGLEVIVILLAFTLAIFVILVLAVRALMIFRKLPVPTDPTDMVKPREFRTLMLAASVLLTPLVARTYLPVEGVDSAGVLAAAYLLEVALGLLLWFALDLFYRARDKQPGSKV